MVLICVLTGFTMALVEFEKTIPTLWDTVKGESLDAVV